MRRSGKTFILYDYFRRFCDEALYIDFEDDRLVGFGLDGRRFIQFYGADHGA